MIRWFFYAAVAAFVCLLTRRIFNEFVKEVKTTAGFIALMPVGLVCIASSVATFVFLFIGLFKVLSHFNCW